MIVSHDRRRSIQGYEYSSNPSSTTTVYWLLLVDMAHSVFLVNCVLPLRGSVTCGLMSDLIYIFNARYYYCSITSRFYVVGSNDGVQQSLPLPLFLYHFDVAHTDRQAEKARVNGMDGRSGYIKSEQHSKNEINTANFFIMLFSAGVRCGHTWENGDS